MNYTRRITEKTALQFQILYKQRSLSTSDMKSSKNVEMAYRLSPLVRPEHYNLLLRPDLKTGSFDGTVKIDLKLKEALGVIKLNSKLLNISEVTATRGDTIVPVTKFSEIKELEQLAIHFESLLGPGDYQLQLKFDGILTKAIVGLYLSRLDDVRTMVASKFQPTYARQAFPCFDEPDFKATFDITLVKPKSHIALSNMNELSISAEENSDLERVSFATSVPMSTYLAVFVICDFDFKEVEINAKGVGDNFVLRSFAQKHETHKIDFAQDIGKRATEFYIQYYEVPFPLPKLDMIAIPDYVSGATEHWGLITYRETSFLVDEATAAVANKISVANTIAHELAHMWFGNLVTMKWWDEIWLNEGFASYMQVKALNAIEPLWSMLDVFVTKTLQSVLVTDAKLSSHPIVQVVNTPDQITAIFDAISYNKGASVLRMLEGFIGEENFRKGVSDYLKQHRFGNTVTQQLLASLEPYFKVANPNLNLTYILDTWTRQMGYPVLTLRPGDGQNTFVVTQSRFLIDPEAVSPNDSPFNYRWFVPITYTTNKGSGNKLIWFADNAESVKITLSPDEPWLKINNNQVGYYRVNYTEHMWRELIKELKSRSARLTISDRSHLLDDSFALAQANVISYHLALDLSTYLVVEEDYVPWETARLLFAGLSKRLQNSVAYIHLSRYVRKLIEPMMTKLSWEKTELTVIDRLRRTSILSIGAKFGVPEADMKIRDIFLAWLNSHGTKNPAVVEPDLREIVYYYGMTSATQAEWDRLWEIYLKETDAQELTKIRSALAAPRDVSILKRYIALAQNEANIRGQDYLTVLQQISHNPSGTNLIWDDVRERWPQLVERFTLNSRYLGNMIPGITGSFNTQARLAEMEAFFAKYKEAGAGEMARKRALEDVRNNIKWTTRYQGDILAWLEQRENVVNDSDM